MLSEASNELTTEQVGTVDDADLYSGDVWFESQLGLPLSWLRFYTVLLSPSRQITE
jgi:hypothetical protein